MCAKRKRLLFDFDFDFDFLISCTRPERDMKMRRVFMWMCRALFPSAEQYVLVLLAGHRGPCVCVKSQLWPRTQVAYHSSCERAPRVFCRLATKSIYSRKVLSSDSVFFFPSWSFSDYAQKNQYLTSTSGALVFHLMQLYGFLIQSSITSQSSRLMLRFCQHELMLIRNGAELSAVGLGWNRFSFQWTDIDS